MTELKRCPCGEIPERLVLEDANQGRKWAWASGSCCTGWYVEFCTGYHPIDSKECIDYATEAWNEAPRGATNDS